MPLRLRVLLLVGLVLLASMVLGALVAGYQVRRALDAELAAGLGGARQTASSAFEDLPHSDHPARDLRQLVQTFDGNRHVRATLIGADGRAIWMSRMDNPGPLPPAWFRRLVEVMPAMVRMPVPPTDAGAATLVLAPEPQLDVRAAWEEFLALMLVLAATTAAGLVLVHLVIGAAFRPLTVLGARFRQIGAGDYTGRVAEAGPSELMHLQRGFNQMAGKLEATTERNRLLTDQLARLQEEERADIARDLHDEIGPHLFAANLDAEAIFQFMRSGRHDAIPERVREIQKSIHYMQSEVRELLGRLRPTQVTEFGLSAAIEELMRFWRAKQPNIAFACTVSAANIPQSTAEVAYRIVQEAVNNAVRHGQPAAIRVVIAMQGGELLVCVEDDGSQTGGVSEQAGSGLGLVGMRERVEAGGGVLQYGPAQNRAGWTVSASLRPAAVHRPAVLHDTRGDLG